MIHHNDSGPPPLTVAVRLRLLYIGQRQSLDKKRLEFLVLQCTIGESRRQMKLGTA